MSVQDSLPWVTQLAVAVVMTILIPATYALVARRFVHEHETTGHYNGRCWCGSADFKEKQ